MSFVVLPDGRIINLMAVSLASFVGPTAPHLAINLIGVPQMLILTGDDAVQVYEAMKAAAQSIEVFGRHPGAL